MERNDKARALDMAKDIISIARKECNNRSVSRKIAFACIFIHRANVSLSDACNYYKEAGDLQKLGLARELAIETENLSSERYSSKRLALLDEAAKLVRGLNDDIAIRDPFRTIEEVTRIDEIVRHLGFAFVMINTYGNALDALFMEAYNSLKALDLDQIMGRYRN